jgi:hypothetical protein
VDQREDRRKEGQDDSEAKRHLGRKERPWEVLEGRMDLGITLLYFYNLNS